MYPCFSTELLNISAVVRSSSQLTTCPSASVLYSYTIAWWPATLDINLSTNNFRVLTVNFYLFITDFYSSAEHLRPVHTYFRLLDPHLSLLAGAKRPLNQDWSQLNGSGRNFSWHFCQFACITSLSANVPNHLNLNTRLLNSFKSLFTGARRLLRRILSRDIEYRSNQNLWYSWSRTDASIPIYP